MKNMKEFGIDTDAIAKSIDDFKKDYLTNEWDIDLYRLLMKVWQDDHARMVLWSLFKMTGFNKDNIKFPIDSFEKLFSLKEFFHNLTYHLFDDGQLTLVRIKHGFPVCVYDEKTAKVDDRDSLFITDLNMEYGEHIKKFVDRFEKMHDEGFSPERYYSKEYTFEYIYLDIESFKKLLNNILKQSVEYKKKFEVWDADREHNEFPMTPEIDLNGVFKPDEDEDEDEDEEDDYYNWHTVSYSKI